MLPSCSYVPFFCWTRLHSCTLVSLCVYVLVLHTYISVSLSMIYHILFARFFLYGSARRYPQGTLKIARNGFMLSDYAPSGQAEDYAVIANSTSLCCAVIALCSYYANWRIGAQKRPTIMLTLKLLR